MKYKVLKEQGHNMAVTLENTETHKNIIIGRLTWDILTILETKEGIRFGDTEGAVKLKDKWDIPISDSTALDLSSNAFRMRKPKRVTTTTTDTTTTDTTTDTTTTDTDVKAYNKTVDAMDVLLGLAEYK